MSDSSIGIQMIEPKTATSPKAPPRPPQERDRENAAFTSEAVTRQAPPPPGMGKLVDKTA
jgi:hypothetical protein